MPINELVAAAGREALQRTYLLERQTFNGIPRVLMVFDAITSETPTYEADVSEVPVEEGPEVTDHVQLKNPKIKLRGEISQTPLDLSVSIGNIAGGSTEAFTSSQFRENFLNTGVQQAAGVAGARILGNASNPEANLQAGLADSLARSLLLSAWGRRARFDVVTKRQRYSSMVIEKMTFPFDTGTGKKLVFELDLKQLRIVRPFTVQIDTVSEESVTSAVDKTDLGKQATSALNPSNEESVNKSTFASIDDVVGITQ